jgi:hypothetical protein
MLTFEVASFDIGYNCILERHFLMKFMVVIYIVYATIKMPSSKGVITIKADQRDALARENATYVVSTSFSKERHICCLTIYSAAHRSVDGQSMDDKKKGADDKEILTDRNNVDKKLRISTSLSAK